MIFANLEGLGTVSSHAGARDEGLVVVGEGHAGVDTSRVVEGVGRRWVVRWRRSMMISQVQGILFPMAYSTYTKPSSSSSSSSPYVNLFRPAGTAICGWLADACNTGPPPAMAVSALRLRPPRGMVWERLDSVARSVCALTVVREAVDTGTAAFRRKVVRSTL